MSGKGERDVQARVRTGIHRSQRSHRPLGENTESIGLAGEQLFSEWSGIPWDKRIRKGGSGSVNFRCRGFAINVFTAKLPYNLICEVGKAKAHIYVLCGYDEESEDAYLIGWHWHNELMQRAPKTFGSHDVLDHWVPEGKLLSMGELWRVLGLHELPPPWKPGDQEFLPPRVPRSGKDEPQEPYVSLTSVDDGDYGMMGKDFDEKQRKLV